METENKNIQFNGKVVTFTLEVKPSATIRILESKNFDKEKLHYIITEQKNSIVLLKYNLDTDLKLDLFIENFVRYHLKYDDLKYVLEKVEIKATREYAIIKNISDENVKKLLAENLSKILNK